MNLSPQVSIVLPSYDTGQRSASLVRAVESVLRQSFADFELLVVDDGSPVHAAQTLAAFLPDTRLRVLVHDGQRGVSAARNTGLACARGGWVALLDNDDAWREEKLNRQMRFLAEHELAACVTDVELHDATLGPHYRVSSSEDPAWMIVTGTGLGIGSSLLATRALFTAVGEFDTTLRRGEDWDWLLRLHLAGHRCGVLAEPLTVCRIAPKAHLAAEMQSLTQLWLRYGGRFRDQATHRAFRAAIRWKTARNRLAQGRRWRGTVGLVGAGLFAPRDFVRYARIVWLAPRRHRVPGQT